MNWQEIIKEEKQKDYYKNIIDFLKEDEKQFIIYPEKKNIFNAFKLASYENVKVVILGQDPYHGENQAHGLCFSVQKNISIPPSLKNIFKELQNDLKINAPKHGNLENWANQGVLLLNSILTVRKNQAGSHSKIGWHIFTDKIISSLNNKNNPVVFLLWGNYAKSKKSLIKNKKHLILEASHPSPLSAYNGFFGCKHFSKANEFLCDNNLETIKWSFD